jgi:hypothetical protein
LSVSVDPAGSFPERYASSRRSARLPGFLTVVELLSRDSAVASWICVDVTLSPASSDALAAMA